MPILKTVAKITALFISLILLNGCAYNNANPIAIKPTASITIGTTIKH